MADRSAFKFSLFSLLLWYLTSINLICKIRKKLFHLERIKYNNIYKVFVTISGVFVHSFTYSKYLPSIYYVSGIVLGTREHSPCSIHRRINLTFISLITIATSTISTVRFLINSSIQHYSKAEAQVLCTKMNKSLHPHFRKSWFCGRDQDTIGYIKMHCPLCRLQRKPYCAAAETVVSQ